jgi:tRNA A37 threonylcarbamoyladenosine biosynthesis protein TsaE
MPRAKRNQNPNADLVKAVQEHTDQIIDFYENAESDRPVIVLDFQRQQLQGYHYDDYRVRLSKESQMVLDAEFKKALDDDKILVLVWDEATQRLLTATFDYD